MLFVHIVLIMKATFCSCRLSKAEKIKRKKSNLLKPQYEEITYSTGPLSWGLCHYFLLFDNYLTLFYEFSDSWSLLTDFFLCLFLLASVSPMFTQQKEK